MGMGIAHRAYRVVNAHAATPLLLVCEHASNAVLPEYTNLGLPQHELDRHIGHDIGAAALTKRLAALLDAPAVLWLHSRLFVDCNRAPSDASWICAYSDGTAIPGNQNLDSAHRALRAALVFNPFHRRVEQMLDRRRLARQAVRLIAIHSFTPVLAGQHRPWQVGIVWRHTPLASTLAQPLLQALRREPNLCVGDNQPYDGRAFCGHTLERHAEPYGTPGLVIEVRQDELAEPAGIERWAQVLAKALGPLVSVSA